MPLIDKIETYIISANLGRARSPTGVYNCIHVDRAVSDAEWLNLSFCQ